MEPLNPSQPKSNDTEQGVQTPGSTSVDGFTPPNAVKSQSSNDSVKDDVSTAISSEGNNVDTSSDAVDVPVRSGSEDTASDSKPAVDLTASEKALDTTAAPASPVASPVTPSETMGNSVAPVVTSDAGKKSKKKWLIPVVGGSLIALLAGGYVLGFYLPNRPENAYKIGLKLTGIATDKVIDYAKDRKAYPSSTFEGTAAFKRAGGSFDLSMKGQSSETAADLTFDANIAGQKVDVELKAADAPQSEYPDLYVKATGIAPFLQQASADPKLTQLDGKWIAVDHTLFDTYEKQLSAQSGADIKELPTEEQLLDATTKVQEVNKDYLFTTSSDKAVLVYKEYVGKATRNSRDAFHYKTGYNKEHLKAYVKALGDALDSSKLNDWSKKQADGKKMSALLQISSLEEQVAKSKGTETFDLYVDSGTKLVQSIVFTDGSDNGGTFTVAQNYTGGDKYPFELSMKGTGSSKVAATFGVTLDTKTDVTLFNAKLDSGTVGDTSLTMEGTMTPSNKKLSVTAPAGAVPLTQVLQQFGIDPSMLSGGDMDEPSSIPSSTQSLTPSRT